MQEPINRILNLYTHNMKYNHNNRKGAKLAKLTAADRCGCSSKSHQSHETATRFGSFPASSDRTRLQIVVIQKLRLQHMKHVNVTFAKLLHSPIPDSQMILTFSMTWIYYIVQLSHRKGSSLPVPNHAGMIPPQWPLTSKESLQQISPQIYLYIIYIYIYICLFVTWALIFHCGLPGHPINHTYLHIHKSARYIHISVWYNHIYIYIYIKIHLQKKNKTTSTIATP